MHVDDADLLQRSIAGSRQEILDHTGHVPMVEQPRRVAQSIRAFLEQQ
jgi:pimeloyl-ACP methyl ester carboxylesterase